MDTLNTFIKYFKLNKNVSSLEMLSNVARSFSYIPYENLTKIIKKDEIGDVSSARRNSREVIQGHIDYGTGGTCFALTDTFLNLVRQLNWQAEPILADRKYGENTHSALLVWIDDKPHILDPGYLIIKPIPINSKEETLITTSFNKLVLVPTNNGEKIDLYTIQQGNKTYRLTFKTSPADKSEFLKAWESSFDWDMMHYLVLTRVIDNMQVYMQDNKLQFRSLNNLQRTELDSMAQKERIHSDFGIDEKIINKAFQILKSQGDING